MMMSFRGASGDEKSSRLCLKKAVRRRFLVEDAPLRVYDARKGASLEMTKTLII